MICKTRGRYRYGIDFGEQHYHCCQSLWHGQKKELLTNGLNSIVCHEKSNRSRQQRKKHPFAATVPLMRESQCIFKVGKDWRLKLFMKIYECRIQGFQSKTCLGVIRCTLSAKREKETTRFMFIYSLPPIFKAVYLNFVEIPKLFHVNPDFILSTSVLNITSAY